LGKIIFAIVFFLCAKTTVGLVFPAFLLLHYGIPVLIFLKLQSVVYCSVIIWSPGSEYSKPLCTHVIYV